MDYDKWVQALKTGDEVALSVGSYAQRFEIVKVERVTATQVVLSRDRRFRRTNGRPVGGSASRFYRGGLSPVTQEIIEGNELAELRGWFAGLNHHYMHLPMLRAMKAAHDATKES